MMLLFLKFLDQTVKWEVLAHGMTGASEEDRSRL